jgi:ubiquinone/menaquinone biosynthesis C-methylase UbiE
MGFWMNGKSVIARALNLDLTHSQIHYARFLRSVMTPNWKWLEVGCGRQILPDWAMPVDEQKRLISAASLVVGIDVDPAIFQHTLLRDRVVGLGGVLPFRDGIFDLVSANMVVEHLAHPEAFLADVYRVLRPGGLFVFHTPNYRHYMMRIASWIPEKLKRQIIYFLERRHEEDVFPTYYRLNTAGQVSTLSKRCGFKVDHLIATQSSGAFNGPLGWLECVPMRLAASIGGGRFNPNLIVALRRV